MRFRYDLRKIHGLVTRDIPHLLEQHFQVTDELVTIYKTAVDEEAEEVKDRLSRAVVLYTRDYIVKQYCTYHQQSLIRLSGELVRLNIAATRKNAPEYAVLCDHLIDTMEKLLSFISHQYTKFIDFNTWLPANYRLLALQQARVNLNALEHRMTQLNVTAPLIKLVMIPFRQFLLIATTDEATYGKVYFLKALYNEVIDLMSGAEGSDISEELQRRLVYVNYNSQAFFEFYTQQFTGYYTKSEHPAEQLERLARLQRSLLELPMMQAVSYDLVQRSIKERLSEWVAQEANLVETKRDIFTRVDAEEADIPVSEPSKLFKLKLNISVAQVAYFVKVLIETSVLETSNVVAMLKSITRIFQTNRSGSIGYGSLHGRYYNVESGARRGVKKILLKMINHIDRTEGIA